MTTHELKTWPTYYSEVVAGRKTAEVRLDDRGFEVGDLLHLREYDWITRRYTGRFTIRKVTHVLGGIEARAMGLEAGFVLMSLAPVCHGQECTESRKSVACDLDGMPVMYPA